MSFFGNLWGISYIFALMVSLTSGIFPGSTILILRASNSLSSKSSKGQEFKCNGAILYNDREEI